MPEEEIEDEVQSLLKFVKLEDEVEKMPAELCGGMRKRLSVARALVGNPKIILFDEPTVALDPPTSGTVCDLIIQLRDLEGVSSIVVTPRNSAEGKGRRRARTSDLQTVNRARQSQETNGLGNRCLHGLVEPLSARS